MSVKDQGMDALANVQAVAAEFDDIPIEAVVKEDCLRRGVWFEPEALRLGHAYARKSYFIFSFDHLPLEDMEGEAVRDELLAYLNRLSDLSFVWARLCNKRAGRDDVKWMPPQEGA